MALRSFLRSLEALTSHHPVAAPCAVIIAVTLFVLWCAFADQLRERWQHR